MQPMMMNYLTMLEFSYAKALTQDDCPPASRMAFIADAVFDFTTYDDDMAALFAAKGIEICNAISNLETFDFIKKGEDHCWYLLLVNTPFFINRIDWGTSIRGAFWRFDMPPLKSCQLYSGANQLLEIPFNDTSWTDFVSAIALFVKDESVCSCPSGDGSLRWPCPSHPPAQAALTFDAAWDAIDWDKWRMQQIRELVRHIHTLTTPAAAPVPAAVVPDGYVLLPRKITEEMHDAAVRAIMRATGNHDCPPAVWSAMIAAAPSPAPVQPALVGVVTSTYSFGRGTIAVTLLNPSKTVAYGTEIYAAASTMEAAHA